MEKAGSSSFLKKSTKKLLPCSPDRSTGTPGSKSFLVLFFEKELLP
jgi:hypothetical protein